MLDAELLALRKRLNETVAEVAGKSGPTVPPSGANRKWFLTQAAKADGLLAEAVRILGPIVAPDYTPTEQPPAKKPKKEK